MKYFACVLSLLSIFLFGFATPASAQTKSWNSLNTPTRTCTSTVNMDLGSGKQDYDIPTIQGFECIVINVLSIAVTMIGITAFIMLVFGALTFLLSGGNPKATDLGKKTMIFAVVGILLAVSAWVVLNFIGVFTGIDVGTFSLQIDQRQGP